MKYYEIHNEIYKTLKEKGAVGWDGATSPEQLLAHSINKNLSSNLKAFFPKIGAARALDLGTGTGTAALFLAQQGFEVKAMEASPEAVNIARQNARALDVKIDFEVQDLLQAPPAAQADYELVVDSSFLHCIVALAEREKIYRWVQSHLKPDGYFFIHTMVQPPNNAPVFEKSPFVFEDSVLWSPNPRNWDVDTQTFSQGEMFPHRRIYSVESLEKELEDNGFQILKRDVSLNEKEPSLYVGWLKKAN